jgi:hypothetical protein
MPELLQTAIRGERGTHPATREHRGRTSMAHTTQHTPKPQALTPKSAVPYELWNRLLEIENVTRTGIAPER